MAEIRMSPCSSRVAPRRTQRCTGVAAAPALVAACRPVVAASPAWGSSPRQHQHQPLVCRSVQYETDSPVEQWEGFPTTRFDPALMNRIDLIGTVGPDALALEPTDTPHLRFWLRVDQKKKTGPDTCTWYSVELWGDNATAGLAHLSPNQLLYVSGTLRAEEFRQEDGTKKVYLYVQAETINKVQDDGSIVRPVSIFSENSQSQQRRQQLPGDGQRYPASAGNRSRPTPEELEQRWRDLFANPDAYWDNRFNKRSPRAPDFKHKENPDRALWLQSDYSPPPAWVQQQLPQLDARRGVQGQQQERPRREPGDWNELFANPEAFWDNRLSKPTPRAPDFVRRDNRDVAFWINADTPDWVREKLETLPPPPPPRRQQGFDQGSGGRAYGGGNDQPQSLDDKWSDLFNNWGSYWDNRTSKPSPRAPDFKHKEIPNLALWLDNQRPPTPSWVFEQLKQMDSGAGR